MSFCTNVPRNCLALITGKIILYEEVKSVIFEIQTSEKVVRLFPDICLRGK